ncbi:MAG: tRNA dihydrouridine synthase DusB [Bradymonadaceae bacterium]
MGIAFEKLAPPRWGGQIPGPIKRGPLVLGPECVIDPPVILSPMAAVTNAPFRLLCRELGAGLVVTEMVNAVGLASGSKKTVAMLDIRKEESPLCVQIFGKDPVAMADAAQVAKELGARAVDVNMGCPMKKVVKSGHGAALLQNPQLVYEIFHAMSSAVSIPVTGKTRAGWEDSDAVDVARAMADGGASAVTIHGRTRSAMYDGHVDLAVIRELKQAVNIKVIGNGDVCDWISARRMFDVTGCDAVMVARGCLGNPWVFREIAADLRGEPVPGPPTLDERRTLLRRHVALYVAANGEVRTCLEIRKHLLWYFRGTPAEKTLRTMLRGLECVDDIHAAIDVAISEQN